MRCDATVEELSRELLTIQDEVLKAGRNLDLLMQIVADRTPKAITGADGTQVEMRDAHERVCRAASGITAPFVGRRGRISGSLIEECMASRKAHLCLDVETDPLVNLAACRAAGIKTLILAPILQEKSVAGVLKIFSTRPGAFGEADLLVAQLLAGAISAGLTRMARDEAYRTRDVMAQRFRATFDQAAVGMAHVGLNGSFLLVNDRFCAIAGHSREALLRNGFQKITHPDDLDADLDNVRRLIAGDIPSYAMEKRYIRADFALVWVNLTVSLVHDQNGDPDFFVAVIEDVSDRKAAVHRASHDHLTGLPNRLWLVDNFRREVFAGSPEPTVLAYIDIDGFKSVNDRLGHAEGDRCLSATAACIHFLLREGDTACRIAGDEFAVLMPRTDGAEAARLIDKIRSAIERLCVDRPWGIGVSIGAVVIDPLQEAELEVALGAADRLMYRAKRTSPNAPIVRTLGDALAA